VAIPKVFVSSTCFDLAEERSQLERFISSYGYQPILSEFSDVFLDPDEHTHDACVNEIEHCDMFVLIISGRFGGQSISGNGESITQAEYAEARRLDKPIFAFVKADVLQAQLYYKENLKKHGEEFANKITYPSINSQNDAAKIFSFIQTVQREPINNGIEAYKPFSDIEIHLKKQWAGLFYKYLQDRKKNANVEHISSVLDKLNNSSAQLQSLVESLHDKSSSQAETEAVIEESKIYFNTKEFFNYVKSKFELPASGSGKRRRTELDFSSMSNIKPSGKMYDYLESIGLYSFRHDFIEQEETLHGVGYSCSPSFTLFSKVDCEKIEYYYNCGAMKSTKLQRFNSLKAIFGDLKYQS